MGSLTDFDIQLEDKVFFTRVPNFY